MSDEAHREAAQRLRRIVTSLTPRLHHLTYAEFLDLPSPVLIDVRSPSEIAAGTLQGAGAPTSTELMQDENRPVVAFCTVGLRSAAYARRRGGVYNYSVMEHLWGGGRLKRPDGQEWSGGVHTYTTRYAGVFPEWVKPEAYEGWNVVSNVLKDVPALMAMLGAWTLGTDSRRGGHVDGNVG